MNTIEAHKYASRNKEQIKNSRKVSCFYCLKEFSPLEIKEYLDDEKTAVCPYCGIDSVLPEIPNFNISKKFLKEMHKYWFQ